MTTEDWILNQKNKETKRHVVTLQGWLWWWWSSITEKVEEESHTGTGVKLKQAISNVCLSGKDIFSLPFSLYHFFSFLHLSTNKIDSVNSQSIINYLFVAFALSFISLSSSSLLLHLLQPNTITSFCSYFLDLRYPSSISTVFLLSSKDLVRSAFFSGF